MYSLCVIKKLLFSRNEKSDFEIFLMSKLLFNVLPIFSTYVGYFLIF